MTENVAKDNVQVVEKKPIAIHEKINVSPSDVVGVGLAVITAGNDMQDWTYFY